MQIQQMSVTGHHDITIHKKEIRGHIIGGAYNSTNHLNVRLLCEEYLIAIS